MPKPRCIFVFTTHDITPNHWADFIKSAAIPPRNLGDGQPKSPPINPYVLVHARSQVIDQSVLQTQELAGTVKTEFEGATSADLWAFINRAVLPGEQPKLRLFMTLDKDSVTDRKVIITHRGVELVDSDGEIDPDDLHPLVLRWRTIWRIHRVPFDKAWDFWAILDIMPGDEGDEFLIETK